MSRIYLSPPHLSGTELDFLKEAVASNWIAPLGPQVDAFEQEMAAYIGLSNSLAVSSGTAALHLALRILGIGPDDEVVCPTLTFVATANPILYQGARPIFIDSEAKSWNMDPALLEQLLESRAENGRLPKAVIVADILGQSADYDALLPILQRFEIPMIEDAAEALGATYRGRKAGSFGDLSILSFNGNKIITTSGGGMLLSNDKTRIQKARFWSTQAREPAAHYEHREMGYNYRLSNLLGAVGRSQLSTLDERVGDRRRIFEYYQTHLGSLEGLRFMPELEGCHSSRWLTCILVDPEVFGASREDIRLILEGADIESRPVWKPLHTQPLFDNSFFVGGGVAEEIFRTGLCLPSGSAMNRQQLNLVIELIQELSRETA